MARTLVTGNILRSGSIPTTALGGGVVTSSLQIVASLPTGSLSSSAQVNYPDISNIPGGIASSSAQVIAYLPTDTVSSSVQVTAFLPTNTVSSSGQVTALLPTGTVSSSGQIDITGTTNYSTFSSSLATVDTAQSNRLTTLESVTGSYATTGSNTFVAPQTISDTTNSTSYLDGALHIAGGMSVRQDVRISGSMTINGLLTAVSMSTQYVTSSQYNVGTSRITLNDDDNVRFAGLSIIDSGSSSPTSASILWDSLQHRFIYENLSGSSYNSSIIIAGPKHTGSLGDEPTLTSGYIPVATGTDHIDNSVIFQSGSNIGIGITTPNYKLNIKGDNNTTPLYVEVGSNARYQFSGNSTSGYNTTFNMDDTGLSIGHNSSLRDFRLQTDSTTRIIITGAGNVGIGTTNPQTKLDVRGSIASSYSAATYATFDSSTDGNLYITANAGAANVSVNTIFRSSTAGGAVTERMRIDSSGNVGIGTTNPTATLQVVGPNTTGTFIAAQNDGAGGFLGVRVNNSSFPYNHFSFNNGHVGIGTTSPASLLHLNGTDPILRLQDSAGGDVFGVYVSDTIGLGIYNFTDSRQDVTIAGSGNVGIGTTNPVSKLQVTADQAVYNNDTAQLVLSGATATTKRLILGFNTTADKAFIQATDTSANYRDLLLNPNAGNVGIGTTNPNDKFQVNGGNIRVSANTTSGTFLDIVPSGTQADGIVLSTSFYGGGSYGPLRINTGGSETMRITGGNRVGIGETNPGVKLHVEGVEYNRGNIVRPTVFAGDAQSAGSAIGTYVLGNGKFFNSGGGAKYVHILLPARYNQDGSRMFCVEIKGYDFDRPGIINVMVGGYVTPPNNGGPMSRVATWDATSYYSPTAYYSTNYAVGVVRIYFPSIYYVSFVVNSIASGNGDTIAPDEMTMIVSTSATI